MTSGMVELRPRSVAFSLSSAAWRSVISCWSRNWLRSASTSFCSVSRVAKLSCIQRQAAEGELTASCSG